MLSNKMNYIIATFVNEMLIKHISKDSLNLFNSSYN